MFKKFFNKIFLKNKMKIRMRIFKPEIGKWEN